jgi:hypothetical protein
MQKRDKKSPQASKMRFINSPPPPKDTDELNAFNMNDKEIVIGRYG